LPVPFFGAPHALAVNDRNRRAGFPSGLLAALHVEGMMDAFQRAVAVPAVEIVVQGAVRRQVLGDRPPLATGAQDVQEPVEDFAYVHGAVSAAVLGRRDQRGHQGPFGICQVALIAQMAAVVERAVLLGPHTRKVVNH